MKNENSRGLLGRGSAVVLLLLTVLSLGKAQTGGVYDLSHNVIASGGGSQSISGTYSVDGTSGQGLAGTISTGGSYSLRGGFWAFQQLAPTAAGVSVGGRVFDAEGRGIVGARLQLTNLSTAETRAAISSSLGFYRFDDVPVGETYIVTVSAKRHSFEQDSRIISLVDELMDVDFMGMPAH